ncbi:unnamed protein product [Cunninghamella blakesleeana]
MKPQFENTEQNFVITGYTSQQDVGALRIRGKVYKSLNVYTKDEKIYTYYFPNDDSHILDEITNTESTMTRYGVVIGIGKVKGVCVVIGTELSDDEVIIYDVQFIPRSIPKNIAMMMNDRTELADSTREVKEVRQRRFMVDFPADEDDDDDGDYEDE